MPQKARRLNIRRVGTEPQIRQRAWLGPYRLVDALSRREADEERDLRGKFRCLLRLRCEDARGEQRRPSQKPQPGTLGDDARRQPDVAVARWAAGP